MQARTMDRTRWDELKRSARKRYVRRGILVAPPAPGVHNVEHDTHRTRGERERAGDPP